MAARVTAIQSNNRLFRSGDGRLGSRPAMMGRRSGRSTAFPRFRICAQLPRASPAGKPCSRQKPLEAARQHLAHHAEIVAWRQIRGLDVELPVLVLHEAFRPCDDHRADGVRAHDMGVVVDLDAARRALESEDMRNAGQQLALARAFGELASERFTRILESRARQARVFRPAWASPPRLCARAWSTRLPRSAPAREPLPTRERSAARSCRRKTGR